MELMQANKQWSTRPDDEKFTSLTALHAFTSSQRRDSVSKIVSSRALSAAPVDGDNGALMITGPNGAPVNVTNWSFGQLAARAGAPAGYLRDLPTPIAADCLNYGLKHARDVESVGVLLTKGETAATARAFTGPNYGRIWNSTITEQLVRHFGDGLQPGGFRIPSEFGDMSAPVTKQSTTLYGSDRDMWVFLADETNRINLPNRRDGKSGSLARGVFFWNSEVGSATFGMAGFLFDYMCGNHIIWDAVGYKELRIRHTAAGPDKYLEMAAPAMRLMSQSSGLDITNALLAAQAKRIDDVDAFLVSRFTKSEASAIKAAHLQDEQRPIETLWDVATGATAYAREISHLDARVRIEREAGKILSLA